MIRTIPIPILRQIWAKECHQIWTEESSGQVIQKRDETHRHLLRETLALVDYAQVMPYHGPHPRRYVLPLQD